SSTISRMSGPFAQPGVHRIAPGPDATAPMAQSAEKAGQAALHLAPVIARRDEQVGLPALLCRRDLLGADAGQALAGHARPGECALLLEGVGAAHHHHAIDPPLAAGLEQE